MPNNTVVTKPIGQALEDYKAGIVRRPMGSALEDYERKTMPEKFAPVPQESSFTEDQPSLWRPPLPTAMNQPMASPEITTPEMPKPKTPGGFGITRIARPGESITQMNARYDQAAKGGPAPAAAATPGNGIADKAFQTALKTLQDIGNKAGNFRDVVTPHGKTVKVWNPQTAAFAQKAILDAVNERFGAYTEREKVGAETSLGIGKLTEEQKRTGLRGEELKVRQRELGERIVSGEKRRGISSRKLYNEQLKTYSPVDFAGNRDTNVGLFRMAMQGAEVPTEHKQKAKQYIDDFNSMYKDFLKETGLPDDAQSKQKAMEMYEEDIAMPKGKFGNFLFGDEED